MSESLVAYFGLFAIVFARISGIIAFLPGIKEAHLPMRIRMAFALVVTLIVGQTITYSGNIEHISLLFIIEAIIGLFIGIVTQIYFQALNVAGNIITMQAGLSAASFFAIESGAQTPVFTNLFTLIALATIFDTNVHHFFLQGILESYQRFPIGSLPLIADLNTFLVQAINSSFIIAFKLAAPTLLVGFAIMVGSGVLARLMPSLQVFFVLSPAQIIIIFATLLIILHPLIAKVIDELQNIASVSTW